MRLFIAISLIISTVYAQEAEHTFLIGANKNYQFHSAEVGRYSGNYNCCGNFSNSTSDGYLLDIFYGISVYRKLDIGFSAAYYDFQGDFKNSRDEILNFGGETFNGSFDYMLKYRSRGFFLSVNGQYEIFRNFYSNLGFGINSMNLIELDGYEKLASPDDIGFFLDENGNDTSRIRNHFTDEIYSQINPFVSLNFSYALPLNTKQTFELRPNLRFNYNLNGFSGFDDWSYFDINFGLQAVAYINRKDPEINFPKEEVIDSLLFVTAMPLTEEQLKFDKYIVTRTQITNSVYSFPGIDIESNESIGVDYSANYEGLSFLYDYSHLNYNGDAFVDIRLGFIEVSIPALGKLKNRLNFKINKENLKNLSDTIQFRLRVTGDKEIRVGPWIKKEINKKENYETELTYFIGDNEVSPMQLESINLIQPGTVNVFSDDEKLLEIFRSYFETMGIKVETEKMKEILPGTRSVIIRQNITN